MLFRTLAILAAIALVSPPLVAAPQSAAKADTAKPSPIVNINTAGATELQQLPGIGERTATRIVEYRQKNGPFKKIEDHLEFWTSSVLCSIFSGVRVLGAAATVSGSR